jgi:hypothetical protein
VGANLALAPTTDTFKRQMGVSGAFGFYTRQVQEGDKLACENITLVRGNLYKKVKDSVSIIISEPVHSLQTIF